jgi:hypothetical protein
VEEIVKVLIGVSPLAGVLFYIWDRQYRDGLIEREQARRERVASLQLLSDIKNRIEDLEVAITGKRSDTHAKRPPELDRLIADLNPEK